MDLSHHRQIAGCLRIDGSDGLRANSDFQSMEHLLGRRLGLCKAIQLEANLVIEAHFLGSAVQLVRIKKVRWAVNKRLQLAY